MILPSKELLSEVLNQAVEGSIHLKGTDLKYIISMNGYFYINIYELQHLMKEWALKQGYYLSSWIYIDKTNTVGTVDITKVPNNDGSIGMFQEPTEFESVCKACEWILENKEKK